MHAFPPSAGSKNIACINQSKKITCSTRLCGDILLQRCGDSRCAGGWIAWAGAVERQLHGTAVFL